jgi:hypothetical protein
MPFTDEDEDRLKSYFILVRREEGGVFFWRVGGDGGWTENVEEARRYAKRVSAAQARHHLLKKRAIAPETFRVEAAGKLPRNSADLSGKRKAGIVK